MVELVKGMDMDVASFPELVSKVYGLAGIRMLI